MRNSKWILTFIVPTLVSAVFFLFLLSDSLRQTPKRTNENMLTEGVVQGKMIFQKYNCNNCHTFFGIGGYYAPDLTKIYKKYGDGGRKLLKDVILNPEKHFSGRKMKKFNNMTAAEAEEIIEYLKWTSEIDNNDWPPVYSKKHNESGLVGDINILKRGNCLFCHKYNDVGRDIGPSLDGLEKIFTKELLKVFIQNPRIFNPNSLMPSYNGEELDRIVELLMKGKK